MGALQANITIDLIKCQRIGVDCAERAGVRTHFATDTAHIVAAQDTVLVTLQSTENTGVNTTRAGTTAADQCKGSAFT